MKLESHDQSIHQYTIRKIEPKLYPPQALGELRFLYNTILKLYKQRMDNRENPIFHPVTNILSNFSGNWVCANSIGKPISPSVTHLSPAAFFF